MNKKDKIKIGTIGGGIAAVVGVLANLTSVLSFFDAKFSNNDRVSVESSSKVEYSSESEYTTLNDIQNNELSEEHSSEIDSGNNSEIMKVTTETSNNINISTEIFTEISEVSNNNNNTTLSNTITEEVEAYKLPVKNICEVEEIFGTYSFEDYSDRMCYDKSNKKLYFVEKPWNVCCYDLSSGDMSCVKEIVYDEYDSNNSMNHISGVYFNNFSQKLYIGGRECYNEGLYDVEKDVWFKDLIPHDFITFLDDKTYITVVGYLIRVCSLSEDDNNSKITQQSNTNIFGSKFSNYNPVAFIHNEYIYYLLTQLNIDEISSSIYSASIYSSKQPIPSDLDDDNFTILDIERVKCYHVSGDNIYYMTIDNDIYRYDIDGQNGADIKLIDGDDIQETYSQYVSKDIDNFIYVNDKCFIVYDNADKTIKLVGTP